MKDKNLTPGVSPLKDSKYSENQYPKEYPAIKPIKQVTLVAKLKSLFVGSKTRK